LHVPRNERINRKLSDVKIFKVDMEIKQKKLWRPDPRPRYVIYPCERNAAISMEDDGFGIW
ncbi:MAG: hypothetical protein ACYC0Q_06220, partial [Eubacteriales bacterium]